MKTSSFFTFFLGDFTEKADLFHNCAVLPPRNPQHLVSGNNRAAFCRKISVRSSHGGAQTKRPEEYAPPAAVCVFMPITSSASFRNRRRFRPRPSCAYRPGKASCPNARSHGNALPPHAPVRALKRRIRRRRSPPRRHSRSPPLRAAA